MKELKKLESKTKVKWDMGDGTILTGSIVAGPYRWKPEEIEERKKAEHSVEPYHNVYCNEMSNYHRVCTRSLKVIED